MKVFYTLLILLIPFLGFGQIPSYINQDSLILCLPLNGNTNDYSPNNYQSSYNGITAATDRFGNSESCFSFDQNLNSHIEFNINSNLINNPFCVSFWAKHSGVNISPFMDCLLAFGQNIYPQDLTNNAININTMVDGNIYFGSWANNSYNNNTYSNTNWTHYVLNYDLNSLRFYENTNLVGQIYNPEINFSDSTFVSIGRQLIPHQDEIWNGLIDDFFMWNKSLDYTDILELYNSQLFETEVSSCDSFLWNGQYYDESGEYIYSPEIEGFIYGGYYEGSLYYLSNSQAGLFSALSICENAGGKLVTISSQEENDTIVNLLENFGVSSSWIGLWQNWANPNYSEPGFGWEWYNTEPNVFSNFLMGEPNNMNGNEDNAYLFITGPYSGYWDDINYSASIHYILEIPANVLNLTVNNSNTLISSITACDEFTWDGLTYTESGEYTNTYTIVNGCDSISTLNLTIINSINLNLDITTCGEYLWQGELYTESGTYTYETISENGCDSIINLNLSIVGGLESQTIIGQDEVEPFSSYIYALTLNGNSYNWSVNNGSILSDNGNNIEVLWGEAGIGLIEVIETDTNGCTITHTLQVNLGNNVKNSWNCVNDACVDPLDGSGEFSTLNDCEQVCQNISSINETLIDVNIYPNPSSNIFTLEFNSDSETEILVTNVLGEQVYFESTKSNGEFNTQIDLSEYSKGIYNLTIKTSDGLSNHKLILQ